MRAALGASRSRVIRQLLTESILVGFLGAALGLGLAWLLIAVARKLGLDAISRLDQASVNGPVLFFAVGLGLLSTLLAGPLPAIRAAQVDVQKVLRQGGRSITGLARDSARSLYIAGEVALALRQSDGPCNGRRRRGACRRSRHNPATRNPTLRGGCDRPAHLRACDDCLDYGRSFRLLHTRSGSCWGGSMVALRSE